MALVLVDTLKGHTERVWHCSWSSDGCHIATCGEDKTIRVWHCDVNGDVEIVTCKAVLEEGQSRTIRCCEWSPDDTMIASASFDGTVAVWQSRNSELRNWDQLACLEGHESEVKCVSWSYDGVFLASCGRDKKIWLWEKLPDNEFECVALLEGHSQDIKTVSWHPAEYVFFSAGYDDTIKIWMDSDDDWHCVQTLNGHKSTVWGTSVDLGGSLLVSCSDDRSLVLWQRGDDSGWSEIHRLENLHRGPIYSTNWNRSGDLIVTGGGDNDMHILSLEAEDGQGTALRRLTVTHEAHEGDVNCVRWNPSVADSKGAMLASSGDDGVVKIWRYQSSTP